MQGFPDSAEQFQTDRKAAISVDSAKVFDAIRDNPTVKAVLVELRHTCYHGVADYGPGKEPTVLGPNEKFAQIKQDAELVFERLAAPESVRIFDAMGALVWSKERGA